jgi:transcriptional regulator with XRE-family HTH domain
MNSIKITTKDKEKGLYVKALLVLHNINMTELAKKIGVSQPLMSAVVTGKRRGIKTKGKRIREAVAQELGVNVEELWPDKAA